MTNETLREPAVTELGLQTHVAAVLAVLGDVAGLELVDIGCGEGQNASGLARAGARVTGFDPFIEPTERTAEGPGSYRLLQGSADALPVPAQAADVALFIFSLHHVPEAKLDGALREARRVLRPGGRLLIAEPLAQGAGHYVSAPFHDETVVRAAAAAAIRTAAPAFAEHRVFAYTERRHYDDFDAYARRTLRNVRFNPYSAEEVLAPEVRRRFAEMLALHRGDFDQPVRIDLLSVGAAAP